MSLFRRTKNNNKPLIRGFEEVVFPKNTIILEDKGYWDFDVIKARMLPHTVFVTRIKDN